MCAIRFLGKHGLQRLRLVEGRHWLHGVADALPNPVQAHLRLLCQRFVRAALPPDASTLPILGRRMISRLCCYHGTFHAATVAAAVVVICATNTISFSSAFNATFARSAVGMLTLLLWIGGLRWGGRDWGGLR